MMKCVRRSVLVLVLVLVLSAACSSKPDIATPPPPNEAAAVDLPSSKATTTDSTPVTCPAGPRIHAKANGEDLELRSDPYAKEYDELAIVDWRTDLNGDSAEDVGLTFMGSSGSKGESVRGVFASCGADQYVAVWGPDYIFAIELSADSRRAQRGWRELIAVKRVEDADREQFDRVEKRTMRFVQGRYVEAP